MRHLKAFNAALFALCCVQFLGSAAAQTQATGSSYPTRPVRLLVGFPPGGSNDIVARVLANEMTQGLGQQVIVDNRPGASGRIANAIASGANPDGQTILLVPASYALDVARGMKLAYKPKKDFSPIALVASAPFVLVVNPNLPVRSTQELIKLARSEPGKLNGAHTGVGNLTHVLLEMFKSMANVDIVSVPYKGGGPALIDVISGRVQMIFTGMPPALPQIKAGRIRLLAVTSGERSPLMPDVPTVAESGVSGYAADGWWGMLAVAGTPRRIIDTLNREVNSALRKKNVSDRLSQVGARAIGGSPRDFSAFIDAEIKKWSVVMKKAGISKL
jgi:tripartite-type tricarboxylate transporter receptor subunit TctC